MVKDRRQGWLKELKEGDEVFIVGVDTDSYEETEIGTVTHITPTGRIGVNYTQYSVEGERKYNRILVRKRTTRGFRTTKSFGTSTSWTYATH